MKMDKWTGTQHGLALDLLATFTPTQIDFIISQIKKHETSADINEAVNDILGALENTE